MLLSNLSIVCKQETRFACIVGMGREDSYRRNIHFAWSVRTRTAQLIRQSYNHGWHFTALSSRGRLLALLLFYAVECHVCRPSFSHSLPLERASAWPNRPSGLLQVLRSPNGTEALLRPQRSSLQVTDESPARCFVHAQSKHHSRWLAPSQRTAFAAVSQLLYLCEQHQWPSVQLCAPTKRKMQEWASGTHTALDVVDAGPIVCRHSSPTTACGPRRAEGGYID